MRRVVHWDPLGQNTQFGKCSLHIVNNINTYQSILFVFTFLSPNAKSIFLISSKQRNRLRKYDVARR